MRARLDEQDVAGILDASALEAYASAMPSDMVPETEVTRLYAALRARLDRETARRIARDAGRRTAGYVLTHRIPHFAQGLFPALPRPLGRRALMLAIRANAWTFAGSARIRMRFAAPASISLRDCPICRNAKVKEPACVYYAATFEHLFRTLIDPAYRVEEVACQAEGARECVFQIGTV
jgi:divinyl protochlorophyllide a 8-vinyl-reductase